MLCKSTCMGDSVTAMGVSIHVCTQDPLVLAHSSALGPQWPLKLGIPLQSFWVTTTQMVTSTFISAICNTLPFIGTWASLLMSMVAWMQVAVLSFYPPQIVKSAMICAIHQVLCKTAWDPPLTVRWLSFIAHRLP